MASVEQRDLQAVVRQIIEQFHPQKIVLFGSQAYGRPTAESDVDLLVVMETALAPSHAAAIVSAAIDHPFPLDILVLQPSDWQAYLHERATFAIHVAEQGLVLYEAGDQGVDRKGRG